MHNFFLCVLLCRANNGRLMVYKLNWCNVQKIGDMTINYLYTTQTHHLIDGDLKSNTYKQLMLFGQHHFYAAKSLTHCLMHSICQGIFIHIIFKSRARKYLQELIFSSKFSVNFSLLFGMSQWSVADILRQSNISPRTNIIFHFPKFSFYFLSVFFLARSHIICDH